MEAMDQVDRLERLVNEGLHIPFTANVIVNETEYHHAIDRLRTLLQEQIRKSSAQEARSFAAAEEEPAVVGPVQTYLPPQIAEHEVVKTAHSHAERIITEAQTQAESIKSDADTYVLDELQQLQAQLEVVLRRIRNGIRTIQREGGLVSRTGRDGTGSGQ